MGVNLCYNCRTFKHEVTEKTSSELVELLLQQPTARVIFRSTCTFRVESLMEVYWISSPIIAAVLIWNCLVWYYSSTDELIMSCEIPNLPSLNTRLLYLFTVIFKTITIITWGIYIIQRPCTGFQSNTSNMHTRRWLHLCGHFLWWNTEIASIIFETKIETLQYWVVLLVGVLVVRYQFHASHASWFMMDR